jgi:hypothetical protein
MRIISMSSAAVAICKAGVPEAAGGDSGFDELAEKVLDAGDHA